ncbi:MAG: hypothetical protein AB8G22_11095 [Saprospiraceae bacterium]
MLKTKVKASSITNLTDARYFAAWDVEWLGFDLNQGSEHAIPLQNIKAIKEWVDGVKIAGEFSLQNTADIKAALELLNLDTVQANMSLSLEELIDLRGQEIIKEVVIERDINEADLQDYLTDYAPYATTFLLDFTKNGWTWEELKAAKHLTLDYLKTACREQQILIGLDFTAPIVEEVLETLHPYGINVRGGLEEKVGYKSFDELDDVFEVLEIFV